MVILYFVTEKIPGRTTHLIQDARKTACGLDYIEQEIDADKCRKDVDCKRCLKKAT